MSRRRRFHQKNSLPPQPRLSARSFMVPLQVLGVLSLVVGALFVGRARYAPAARADVPPSGAGRALLPDDLTVQMHQVVIPDDVLNLRNWTLARPWRLPGTSRPDALVRLADVPDAASFLRCDGSGCQLWPSFESLSAMAPAARTRLYASLAETPDNPQDDDTFYRPVEFGPFSAIPNMPPEARPLIDALTWSRGGVPAFSDIGPVCARLGSRDLCFAFVRSLLSRRSAAVSLRVADPGAVGRVVGEFPPAWRETVGARIDAARAAGGATVPLASLLPAWARERLDTFPAVGEDWTNCYWSVLRFVDDARGVVHSSAMLDEALARDFTRLPAASQVGDVLVFRDARGTIIHSATRLLGGYVFTKNGHGRFQAWRIVPMTDLTADYWQVASVESWRRR